MTGVTLDHVQLVIGRGAWDRLGSLREQVGSVEWFHRASVILPS
jgi:hypothetical protein